MNSQVIVIEHATSNIASQLKCKKIEYNNQSKDQEIHRWLIANSELLSSASKLIIPVRLGNEDAEYMGLYVGMHIRLTRELENARCVPILFITDDTKEEILSNQINNHKEKSGLLLFTKGTYLLSAFLLDEYLPRQLSPITENTLIDTVIPILNVENSKDPGHQLANDWGAFRLAKFAGHSLLQEKPTSLYFKYKDSFTNNEIVPNQNQTIGLFNESCRALLIDDNAALGWSEIIKHILRSKIVNPSKSVSLDVIMTFEEALSFPDYLNYDVVFLDLRLLKEEDKGNHISNIEDFTGAKVLKKIKDINRGIQVVIFTASNKVWNIEKLLKAGANGYYIKESPEYTLNSRFSKDNYDEFIKTIKTCLSRKPLKNVYSLSCSIRQTITSLTQLGKFDQNFADSILNYLDLANKLINSADDKNDYAMSYLILFKCVEMINDKFVVQDTMGNWIISTTGTPLKQYKFSQPGSYLDVLPALFTNNQPTTFEKIAGLAFQQLGCNASFVQDMYYNIKRRNHYIHPTNTQNFTPYQLSEIEKIYCYSGYTDLLTSIKDFFQKLETSL